MMSSFSLKLCHRFNNREQDFKLSNSARRYSCFTNQATASRSSDFFQ